jgi:hypothetical protein
VQRIHIERTIRVGRSERPDEARLRLAAGVLQDPQSRLILYVSNVSGNLTACSLP